MCPACVKLAHAHISTWRPSGVWAPSTCRVPSRGAPVVPSVGAVPAPTPPGAGPETRRRLFILWKGDGKGQASGKPRSNQHQQAAAPPSAQTRRTPTTNRAHLPHGKRGTDTHNPNPHTQARTQHPQGRTHLETQDLETLIGPTKATACMDRSNTNTSFWIEAGAEGAWVRGSCYLDTCIRHGFGLL